MIERGVNPEAMAVSEASRPTRFVIQGLIK